MSRVTEINGDLDMQLRNAKTPVCVVDFYATWCNPCKMLHPRFDEMSMRYTDVSFFRVDSDRNRDIATQNGIRALPTLFFYLNGQHVDTIQGLQVEAIEAKINELRAKAPAPFSGKGFTLSSGDSNHVFTNDEIRKARMARFNQVRQSLEQKRAQNIPQVPTQQPKNDSYPSIPNNEYIFNQLAEMGFEESKIKKALEQVGPSLNEAIGYLSSLQEEEEKGQRIVCDGDTCRIVKDSDPDSPSPPKVESSSKFTVNTKSLEEKKQDLLNFIEQRKKQKAELDKAAEIEKEKTRRKEGKLISNQLQEYEKIVKEREAEQRKKEKQQAIKERERQMQLWKEEHGIPLNNENEIQEEVRVNDDSKAESLIQLIKTHREGNQGKAALELLSKIFNNVLKDDEKFRSINVDSKGVVNKLKPVKGAITLLKFAGFQQIEDKYVMLDVNERLIQMIIQRIDFSLTYP